MKNAAIIAVFVAASFVGIKPADGGTVCSVHMQSFQISQIKARNYNVPLLCPATQRIVKRSVTVGDASDGRYGFKIRIYPFLPRKWFACYNIGDAANYPYQHTYCRSGHVTVTYKIKIV